jgi:membrane-associated protease RseP (regulator of RpoE activity)
MTSSEETTAAARCPQNFKVWVAFVMGMVIIVTAIVIFDRVLGMGRLTGGTPTGAAPAGTTATTTDPATGTGAVRPATYLALTGGNTETPTAWLGIEGTDVSKETARLLGLDLSGGVLVSKVAEGSPADKDGIKRGDIIYDFDRQEVKSVDELVRLLVKMDPGDRVRIVLLRDGDREVLYVKLGEAAKAPPDQPSGDLITSEQKWGIAVSELTPGLRAAFDIPKREKGVVIVMVLPQSAAARAGLRRGDLIKQVDRNPVESLAEFFENLNDSSRHVLLKVYRDGAEIFVHVVAVSPFMRTGGGESDSDDDTEEIKGYQGQPETMPPMGKPSAGLQPAAGTGTATALTLTGGSGDDADGQPTCTRTQEQTQADDDETPVCKRVKDLETVL